MILCCGEALIDMLPRQLEDGEGVFLPVPGGAVFNTAMALGRLGEKAGFFSSLSTDMFGDQLVNALEASSVDASLCLRKPLPTTLAFVKLTDGQAEYSFFDENSAGRNLEGADLPNLPDEVRALHFGAISLISEPCGGAYEKLMERNQDKLLSLDPNIRPGFITDPSAHRQRISRMAKMVDIIKVSDEDLEWIADGQSADSVIDEWLKGSVSVVLLTKGKDGVSVFSGSSQFDMPAPTVKVVDTIGAGDTFNAGMLAGLRENKLLTKAALAEADEQKLRPAVELALKVAAITCSRPGANPPWRIELT